MNVMNAIIPDTSERVIRSALESIAMHCDGARKLDSQGFNKLDRNFGRSLISQDRWSPGQLTAAARMANKYRHQLGEDCAQAVSLAFHGIESEWSWKTSQNEASTVNDPPKNGEANRADPPESKYPSYTGPEGLEDAGLRWSQPLEVETRRGPKLLRKSIIPTGSIFWSLWKKHKDEMKKNGLSVGKTGDKWEACWWSELDNKREQPKIENTTIPDDLRARLLDWQPAAVEVLSKSLARHGVAVDASDTGTGKTTAALATAKLCGLKPLVICSKPGKPTWMQWAKHISIEIDVLNYEKIRTGRTQHGTWETKVLRGGRQWKSFRWTLPPKTLVICDEVHKAGAENSLNSKMVRALKRQRIPTLLLSATLAENPIRMRAVGFALGLYEKEGDFRAWAMRNGCTINRWNGFEYRYAKLRSESEREKSRTIMTRIHNAIFGVGKGVRIRTTDCPGFPDNKVIAEILDFEGSTKIRQAYSDMQAELDALDERQRNDASCVLTIILRARQRIELLKVPTFCEIAQDLVEEGNSVVLFLNFQDSIDAAAKILNTRCIITGKNPNEREHWRSEFQEDRERILIANTEAGGESLSVHDLRGEFPRVTLISPTNKARGMKQLLGRAPRAGAKSKVVQKILYCAGTQEETTALTVAAHLNNLETLNDGDLAKGLPWEGYA